MRWYVGVWLLAFWFAAFNLGFSWTVGVLIMGAVGLIAALPWFVVLDDSDVSELDRRDGVR